MFSPRAPKSVPTSPANRRDFLNRFPPEGEIWVIIEVNWDYTSIFADENEIIGGYTVKLPAMSTGTSSDHYASVEALHGHASRTLSRELLTRGPNKNWVIRWYSFETGNHDLAMQRQRARLDEQKARTQKILAEYTEPSPRYK